jgi:geranylgeranyl pyrophosphate synthase
MSQSEKLWDRVKVILNERGNPASEFSKQYVLQDQNVYGPLREALRYFLEDIWCDLVHPALISLGCEAVGGSSDETVGFGAAIVLLAGAADIHDDIIDQSVTKGDKPTVFGKFGKDVALLAGDALLLKSLYLLHDICGSLPKSKSNDILETVKRTFFEISSGEIEEITLRGKIDITKQAYLNIVEQKVAAAEATMRIGAIVGNGEEQDIALMSHYGRTLGILLALRDEFVDIFEPDEIKNRFEQECLPLPVLLALHDDSKRSTILKLLKSQITEESIEKILDLSIDDKETRNLETEMKSLIAQEIAGLSQVKQCRESLELLLNATLEDL